MSANVFNSIKVKKPNRNRFDLSHDHKLSCNMGELVPVTWRAAIPGDKWDISAESLIRFAPLVAPVMHRMDVSIHYFFVPNRLLWPGWEEFITTQATAGTILTNPAPFWPVTGAGGGYSPLLDHLGVPTPVGGGGVIEEISALPLAAYQMVYNEYYRDENLISPVNFQLVDGDNSANSDLNVLRNRCWEHDYFTSSLPFAQKGTPVNIPGDIELDPLYTGSPTMKQGGSIATGVVVGGASDIQTGATGTTAYDPDGSLVLNASLNDLRVAERLQEWLERLARGGSRYIEVIRNFFGVNSSDKRLQRPEYITGVKTPVMVSEVLNTTGDAGTGLPQGNMSGHAVSIGSGHGGSYYCEEHGIIIGIMSVMPKTAYQQGLEREWLKFTPYDYFWDQFANIGEQEVKNREVYAFQGSSGSDTFGYVPRYSEYKFAQNMVSGQFRSSLDTWHFGRIFTAPPALNSQFVTADPTTRTFAVTTPTVDHLYCHIYNQLRVSRLMPVYGTPTL